MHLYLKKLLNSIALFYFLVNCLQSQKTFSSNRVTSNNTNSTTIPAAIECFVEYKISKCDSCPPSRLSINSKNIIIENKQLANNIDKIFEKSRHISTIKSRIYK
jgi:hypothetical protein